MFIRAGVGAGCRKVARRRRTSRRSLTYGGYSFDARSLYLSGRPVTGDSSVTETPLWRPWHLGRDYHGSVHSQITVRPALPEDYDAVARITMASYVTAGYYGSPDHPYLQKLRDVAGRARHADVFVAERDGQVIGSVTSAKAGGDFSDIGFPDELEMRTLVVDPEVQRSGAGRALVQAVVDQARSMEGIKAVSLTTGATWESANALYAKTGFKREPERDWFVPGTDIKLFVYRQDVRQP